MSYRDGRVSLVAHVDPVLRDYARIHARDCGLTISEWVQRIIMEYTQLRSIDECKRRIAALEKCP